MTTTSKTAQTNALVPATEMHFGTKDASLAMHVGIPARLIGQRFAQLPSAAARAQYRRASHTAYRQTQAKAVLRMPMGAMESRSA